MKTLTAPPTSGNAGTRPRRTPLLSALAGLAVLIAGTIATVSPASAATASAAAPLTTDHGISEWCDNYVCGDGYFSWTVGTAVYKLTGYETVSCYNGATYGEVAIEVEDTTGWHAGVWHENTYCNGQGVTWVDLTWSDSYPIKAWEVKVTRSGGGVASGNEIAV
jgi:hypothetical protein